MYDATTTASSEASRRAENLNAATLGVLLRAARLTVARLIDELPREDGEAIVAHLAGGAALGLDVSLNNPPVAKIYLQLGLERHEIAVLTATPPADALQ